MATEVVRRGAPVTRPRVSFAGGTTLRLNRVAGEALPGRYVAMRVEQGGVVVLRSRDSLPTRGGDGEVLYGTLTPLGSGLLSLRIGSLVKRFSLPTTATFAVIPEVRPGEVSFAWPLEV